MNGYLQPIAAVVCVAAASVSAPAYAQQWQGAWDTNYGQLRLVQDGDHVFGDYGGGTIEGIYDASSGMLRAVFRNPDGATGYAEFQMQSDFRSFVGAWNWAGNPLPDRRRIPDERRWTGQRTATTVPPIVNFRLPGNRSRLLSSAPAKYRDWVNGFNRPAASAVPQVNPLAARIPKLADFPADFRPRFFTVEAITLDYDGPGIVQEGTSRAGKVFGTMGIYAYCETAQGSRPLTPFGGLSNRIINASRENPIQIVDWTSHVLDRNQTSRRFSLDPSCLSDPDARISVQFQTNLSERELIRRSDVNFGYKSVKFYLDQFPSHANSEAGKIFYNFSDQDGVELQASGLILMTLRKGNHSITSRASIKFD